MRINDRVFLTGGYSRQPEWLAGGEGHYGVIDKFIPGKNEQPAAVVRFERPVTVDGLTAPYAVLELRYEGATWRARREIVHIELCDFLPDDASWQERRRGTWVESHASVIRARR